MMMKGRTIFSIMGMVAALVATMLLVHSCGIYSFTGTSIQPEVKTVTINYFEYQALKVNPSLSNDLTNALQDKFLKLFKVWQLAPFYPILAEHCTLCYGVVHILFLE